MRIYYGVKRVVKRSVLDYTWLSAVAEIGGYVGLLLGIAVVDIAFAVDRYWLKITNFFVNKALHQHMAGAHKIVGVNGGRAGWTTKQKE